MLEKLKERLTSLPFTLIAGGALVLKLLLKYVFHADIPVYLDPSWIAILITGFPLVYEALEQLIHNKGITRISSALLISIGMAACIVMSLMSSHDELFAAGEIGFIMSIGELLEDATTEHARKGLRQLISLVPQQARVLRDGADAQMLPLDQVRVGDTVRVLTGETIPVDGEILSGETSVDQSVMTGESLPVDKSVGDQVYCGTLNCFAPVDIRTAHVSEDSAMKKLIRLVKEADEQQAPIARLADRAAGYLVPAALAIALLTYIISGNIEKAVTILVVFCPCALVLATPTAIMAGIGQATKHGVIIKNGEALEKMGRADTVCLDKTGTLTKGTLRVSDVWTADTAVSADELLLFTASAEARSEHPLGKAICADAGQKGMSQLPTADFRMTVGKGVSADVNGKKLLCGSEKLLTDNGVSIPETVRSEAARLRNEGKATVIAAADGCCIGIIALSDELRSDTPSVISGLRDLQMQPVLLTGDNEKTARFFAQQVGIDQVSADLLPQDKAAAIAALKQGGSSVCMVGDGVNDALALKTADIGVAMGGMGSDIAQNAAEIVLMQDDISKLPYLKKLSVETVRTIKTGISLSLIINALAILFSLLGVLNPTTGALWHNAGSVFVVLLAARLYDRKIM